MSYNAAVAKLDMPERVRALPVDRRGFPVPKFVKWIDGQPDFRVVSSEHMTRCITRRVCWVCGDRLGRHVAFVCGPSSAITRRTVEPPSHLDCAEFALKACPFIMYPERGRGGFPDGMEHAAAVINLDRNPGCWLLWVTDGYEASPFGDAVMFKMREPSRLEWRHRGGVPTRDQARAALAAPIVELYKKVANEQQRRQLDGAIAAAVAAIDAALPEARRCPDCGVSPGHLHADGCDVERCPCCGRQAICCGCDATAPRMPWTGEWPGVAQCRELGWFARLMPGRGWVPCAADDPDATADLNRLMSGRWDAASKRWMVT